MIFNNITNGSKIKILLKNNKILKGFFLGCDTHTNIVLYKCIEYKLENSNIWKCRNIGLCVIRGSSVVCILKEKKT